MKASPRALSLIRSAEGFRAKSYPDPATGGPPWTVGYGSTGVHIGPGLEITVEYAEQLLAKSVAAVDQDLARCVRAIINQNQHDALVSFVYNLGIGTFRNSTLLKLLNAGDYPGAAEEILKWNHAGGKVMAGLTARRLAEYNLFKEPV